MARVVPLRLPAGFGEIAMIWSKLSTVTRDPRYADITWEATICPDDPRGALEFVSLLPGVQVRGYGTHTTPDVLQNAIPANADFAELLPGPLYPATDYHLIRGNALADWLPGLDIDYHYPLHLPERSLRRAAVWNEGEPFLLIYPSARWRRHGGYWGNVWSPHQWADLIVRVERGASCPVYVLSSRRDQDMAADLVSLGAIHSSQLAYAEDLADTLALVQKCAYLIGFPAGPAVAAGVFGTPHCMLFRDEGQRWMRGTFTDPQMVAAGTAYLPLFTEYPGRVAAEVLQRLPAALRSANTVLIPPAVPGTAPPDRTPLLERMRMHLSNQDPDGGRRSVTSSQVVYALGRILRPRLILAANVRVSVEDAVEGCLDTGGPVHEVYLLGRADRGLRLEQLAQRSSPRPAVYKSPDNLHSRRAAARLNRAPGYGMALVDGAADNVVENIHWAWSLTGCPGCVVVEHASEDLVGSVPQLRPYASTIADTLFYAK